MFVMLYVTRIILKTLGTEDFGIYEVVGGAISMLGFLNTSMASTVQRFLNNAQSQADNLLQRKVFNIGVLFHISIAFLMVVVLSVSYFLMFNGILNISPERINAAKIVYLCLLVSTFLNIITVPYDATINAHEDMLTYSIIGIIDIFLKLGVALLVVYSSTDKLILYALLMMIVPLATYLMMKIWCMRHYEECRILIRKYYDKELAYKMISFSGWNLLGTSSKLLGNYGNNLTLNHFFGTTLNAVMGIANQFHGMLMVLSVGMLRSLNPIIYKSGETNKDQMMQYSFFGCKYSYMLFALLAYPIMIETKFVLQLWLGTVPVWAVLFVRLQLLRCLLEQLTVTLSKSLESVGRIKEYNLAICTFNLLPILILCIAYSLGMPPYGHYIVAILFMVIFVSIFKIFYCIRYCGLDLKSYSKNVLLPCFYSSILPLLLGLLMHHELNNSVYTSPLILFLTAIATIISCLIMLSQSERIVIKTTIFKIIKKQSSK